MGKAVKNKSQVTMQRSYRYDLVFVKALPLKSKSQELKGIGTRLLWNIDACAKQQRILISFITTAYPVELSSTSLTYPESYKRVSKFLDVILPVLEIHSSWTTSFLFLFLVLVNQVLPRHSRKSYLLCRQVPPVPNCSVDSRHVVV